MFGICPRLIGLGRLCYNFMYYHHQEHRHQQQKITAVKIKQKKGILGKENIVGTTTSLLFG